VLAGEKRLLKIKIVKFCNPPPFDEIGVIRLYDQVKALPGMDQLFPTKFPKGRSCCKAYMYNCWNTMHEDMVQKVIAHAN
jgi:hypothetical protein